MSKIEFLTILKEKLHIKEVFFKRAKQTGFSVSSDNVTVYGQALSEGLVKKIIETSKIISSQKVS